MKFHILVVPYMRRRGETLKMAGSCPTRFHDMMHDVRDQLVFAEGLGYDGFCMTEQHMQVEGIETTTNPLFWNMYIAQHTKKMRVGQLGMNLTAVNPVQLAENMALLDHMTEGRAFFGFSRGNTPRWTATFGQHLDISSTHSDRSEADQRNRRAFYENWEIVKRLWTEETIEAHGEFWKIPHPVDWRFNPTAEWGRGNEVDEKGRLKRIGIVPRPYQQPYPDIYAPFSYSMETCRFWAREGGKMVSFVHPDKEEFMPIVIDGYLEEAAKHGRDVTAADAVAIGGHLTMGRTPAETQDIYEGFEWLFKFAYDAPPYNVPMGRVWKGSRQEVLDHVAGLRDRYGVNEFFLWHHVGYFPQEQEMAMLNEFAEGVIKPLRG